MAEPIVLRLTWDDIQTLMLQMVIQMRADGLLPDVVVGIERGGLIPSVSLSHLLSIRDFYSLPIRRTISDDVDAPKSAPNAGNTQYLNVLGKKVLIVDDVIASGETFQLAQDIVNAQGASHVVSAVLVRKSLSKSVAPKIDYLGTTTTNWVIFPWERDMQ